MKLNEFLKGKNRKQFARLCGIEPTYLDNLASNGKARCGIRTAIRIVEASKGKVTLADLLPKEDVKLVARARK